MISKDVLHIVMSAVLLFFLCFVSIGLFIHPEMPCGKKSLVLVSFYEFPNIVSDKKESNIDSVSAISSQTTLYSLVCLYFTKSLFL